MTEFALSGSFGEVLLSSEISAEPQKPDTDNSELKLHSLLINDSQNRKYTRNTMLQINAISMNPSLV